MFTLENVIALYFHCLTILLNHSPDSCNLSQSQVHFCFFPLLPLDAILNDHSQVGYCLRPLGIDSEFYSEHSEILYGGLQVHAECPPF